MLKKTDIPDLPGRKLIINRTGKSYEIISASVMRWAGLVAVLRCPDGEERKLAIHTAVWDSDLDAYVL
jgi:hypothetical protein